MDMLALRAKTEAGWVLASALVLSGFLFFRYLNRMYLSLVNDNTTQRITKRIRDTNIHELPD
uniref:Uncharacterized protein n=1 Tax=Candidatus Kentrum sp. LFY TaxID=2126342 RepID=A0A450UHJ2_9GAMM|nr:MAG: hypothetical protein BECKLFY1418B_GA0070995_103026 [Candidatus Kentron sp. LFY]VFJ94546.1 MAG: hypothetical protein BECKLFY1418A_GA0070994_104115 [Candidatus Kentron sp. LFY]